MTSQPHWLTRSVTIRRLWALFAVVLALTLCAELLFDAHGHFGLDGTVGFNAWYGFAACVAMIIMAKLLGMLLKRPDTYYDA